ncbi:MAG: hypothetical protein M1812_001447 [Candelaria pacifica]|nr:MAG: hypothetical protein M1812_001447 [Candelaria pacifica]
MAALFSVIGLFSAGLGAIGFTEAQLPKAPPDTFTAVKIQVGLDGTTPEGFVMKSSGGNEPYTRALNDNGVVIASVDGGRQDAKGSGTDYLAWKPRNINSGGFVDQVLKIHKDEYHNQQATSIEVNAGGDDSICIAFVTTKWAGGESYGWLGDAAKACGKQWGYSRVHVGVGDDQQDYQPNCAWIDGNKGANPGGLTIYMPKFQTKDPKYKAKFDPALCKLPIMDFFPNSNFKGAKNYVGTHHLPRGLNERALITSRNPQQSARELCEHPNSAGPDFISLHEGLFCDMATRELKPLCSPTVVENCFALDSQSRVIGKRENVRRAEEYGQVQEW